MASSPSLTPCDQPARNVGLLPCYAVSRCSPSSASQGLGTCCPAAWDTLPLHLSHSWFTLVILVPAQALLTVARLSQSTWDKSAPAWIPSMLCSTSPGFSLFMVFTMLRNHCLHSLVDLLIVYLRIYSPKSRDLARFFQGMFTEMSTCQHTQAAVSHCLPTQDSTWMSSVLGNCYHPPHPVLLHSNPRHLSHTASPYPPSHYLGVLDISRYTLNTQNCSVSQIPWASFGCLIYKWGPSICLAHVLNKHLLNVHTNEVMKGAY